MASPSEKLADSLSALKALQDAGAIAIRTSLLSPTEILRRLLDGGHSATLVIKFVEARVVSARLADRRVTFADASAQGEYEAMLVRLDGTRWRIHIGAFQNL